MDKGSTAKGAQGGEPRWSWLPAHMPGVARLMLEKRRALGNEHVNECWRRGVVHGEPGWFFAREGPLAVGTPWPEIVDIAGWQVTASQALLVLHHAPQRAGGGDGA